MKSQLSKSNYGVTEGQTGASPVQIPQSNWGGEEHQQALLNRVG
jgi:hypothetical protein